jgi:uncharacterized alpha-E superfamily protein
VATCELFGLLPPATEKPLSGRLVAGVDDESWWGSLASTLRRTHWAATQARERLSLDHWHALTRLGELLRRPPGEGPIQLGHLPATLDRVLLACISLAGFAMDDMTRDAGWRFLILGRRIERLQNRTLAIGRFLDHCDGRPQGIDGLLDLADSTETYRQRYLRTPDIVPTLDLVVFDSENPHSVAFQADMLLRYLQPTQREVGRADFWSGAEDSPDTLDASAFRTAIKTLQEFSLADIERGRRDAPHGPGGRVCAHCGGCTELAARLRVLHDAAGELSNRIAARIFAHAEPASRTVSS